MNGCKNDIEEKDDGDQVKVLLALVRSIEDLTRKLSHVQGSVERLASRM